MLYSQIEKPIYSENLEKFKIFFASDDIQILAKCGGGNSIVYCLNVEGRKWALKSYPPHSTGQRDRLAAELMVYQFLNQHQTPFVPSLKTFCDKNRWLIINWIEGHIPQNYTEFDIEQALQFIQFIDRLNDLSQARNLSLAAEPCLSLTALYEQINYRYLRLYSHSKNEPALEKFLLDSFYPTFEKYQKSANIYYDESGIQTSLVLSQENRSLIPADFGFHNSIRDISGKLYFFDFDYFGWDDPVKLLADILWHPKMNLDTRQKNQFVSGFTKIYSDDGLFLTRFHATLPLFGLRWVLILLNEYIPEIWKNRQHANVYQDQTEAKKIQLNRAKELLLNVEKIGIPK